jgi:non-heme chloroperoxidase
MKRRTIVLTAMGVILGGVLLGDTARAADGAATTGTGRGVYDRSDLRKVDYSGLPAPTTITARDGTPLSVRVYPSPGPTVILALHGSSGHGRYYHSLAQYLSMRGKASVYVPDLRGHGASGGRRGDVDYVGQLEDDVADVLAIIRRERPGARIVLLGHSAGGGLVVRAAGGSRVSAVDGYVLLAPFLGANVPTTRPDAGGWATPDMTKIIEVATNTAMGNTAGQDAIVLRFNMPPSETATDQVLAYSFRMMTSYNPRLDLASDLAAIRRPLLVLAGDRDESFYAERYEPTIAPHAKATVRVLPGVTHLGLVVNPLTAEAIETWLGTLP